MYYDSCERLSYLFDAIVTGDDVAHVKPDPALYLLALARLGTARDYRLRGYAQRRPCCQMRRDLHRRRP